MVGARLFPLLALCTLAACKDPTNEKLSDLIDEYDYERDTTRELLCECPGELGFPTTQECEADIGDVGSVKACLADAFEGNEQLGVDYFTCVVPIERSYWMCLEDYAGCAPSWFATCDMQDVEALETCPDLPADVGEAYVACLSG